MRAASCPGEARQCLQGRCDLMCTEARSTHWLTVTRCLQDIVTAHEHFNMDDFVGQFQIALQVTSPKKRMFLLDWMGVSQPSRAFQEFISASCAPSQPSSDTRLKAAGPSAGACKRPRSGHCGVSAAVSQLFDGLPDRPPHGSPQQSRQGPAGEQHPVRGSHEQAGALLAGSCACRGITEQLSSPGIAVTLP